MPKRKVSKVGDDWLVFLPRFGFSSPPHVEVLACDDWNEAMDIAHRGVFGAPGSASTERAQQFNPFYSDGSDRWSASGRARSKC